MGRSHHAYYNPIAAEYEKAASEETLEEIKKVASELNKRLGQLTPEERQEVESCLTEGFCPFCWEERPIGTVCHCDNDE